MSDYYLLNDCSWSLMEADTLYLINSQEELFTYFNCVNGSPTEIDFSRQTLLLVSGRSTSGIHAIFKQLMETERNRYTFDIDITLNMTMEAPRWIEAVLISKMSDDAVISLNVNQHY